MTYYDDISDGYEELHREEQLKKINIIKKYVTPKKHEKLLDVGCGSGISTEIWDCEKYGIDPSKKLIEIAKKKIGTYSIASAEKLNFPDNFFDYVISVTAIQNFDDVKKALNEIKRVAKNTVVITALRKSSNIEQIKYEIDQIFSIKESITEEKDLIYICVV